MLTMIGLGILSSIATELITWVNKKLAGTVLAGDAAYLLSLAVSFIAALFVILTNHSIALTFSNFGLIMGSVWATSQVFFTFVVTKLNLTVQPTN